MRLFDIMHNFTDELPPEGIELLVCDNPDNPDDRIFERATFYKKGSMLPNEYIGHGTTDAERFFDYMANHTSTWEPAPETGYYILVNCPVDNRVVYKLCCINPLDSTYIIMDPLDEDDCE